VGKASYCQWFSAGRENFVAMSAIWLISKEKTIPYIEAIGADRGERIGINKRHWQESAITVYVKAVGLCAAKKQA
jgi:hypothetical protein